MARKTFIALFHRSTLLLFAVAAILLASACGGGGGGTVQTTTPTPSKPIEITPKPAPDNQPAAGDQSVSDDQPASDDEQPASVSPTEPDPVIQPDTIIAGARINRIKITVANPAGPIDFQPDTDIKVRGRIELVEELEKCLAASVCAPADNWLFLGESDISRIYKQHWTLMSVVIQMGAGADPTRNYYPASIRSINVYAEGYTIDRAIRAGTIPKGAWINWSRLSSFGTGGFDTSLLLTSSVVVAASTNNFGSDDPYMQLRYDSRLGDFWLNQAIDNTAAIFVYGLNNAATDIHPGSSRCGTVVMRVCIGVRFEGTVTHESYVYQLRGTSYSTAILSGTAWAMRTLWPHLTARQIAAIMLATARPLRSGVNEYTGVGALDFTQLFEPVGPVVALNLDSEDLEVERGYLHLPGLTDFDNPQGADSFARSFQLVTSALSIQPGFADFDLDRFTPATPGSRLHLAVRRRAGGAEDVAVAFGHTNKLVLSSRYIGLCRDGDNTDLCLTTTRREDFFGGQGSGSFRLEDTTYTSLAATHRMPIRDRLELGFGASITEARTSGRHLVGDVAGRLLQAEISLNNSRDTRSRKSSTSMSIWGSRFDGSMELLGRQSQLTERSAGVRLRWKLEF